jgi:hypothetical protein
MMRGDFAAAWRVCDRVLAARRGRDCSRWPRHLQHIWDGSSLAGKHVLVRCYHGLGDTLQFVRLLAPLHAQAQRITLWAQPALVDLLRGAPGVDAVLPLHDGPPDLEYDVDIELMETPHALRLSVCDLPGPVPYLSLPRSRTGWCEHLGQAREESLRVGIAWRSGGWNDERSLPAYALRMLEEVPHVRWFSLQYPREPACLEMAELGCREITELAARMQRLDLVISVDTMTAHLAGALALPVWTVLPHECDWRWMRARRDTPWYPTMRLFRQSRPKEWRAVVADVARELGELGAIRARGTRSACCRASSG